MLKGKQQVAKNRNGAGSQPVSSSHGAKKTATKGSNKKMKKVALASVATKGKRHGSAKCETRPQPASMKGKNLSLQGRAITVLTDREWEQLMDALDNPKGPGPQLKKIWQKYA